MLYSFSSNDEGRCPGMGGGNLSAMLIVLMGEEGCEWLVLVLRVMG